MRAAGLLVLTALLAAPELRSQEPPVVAGEAGVPIPRRTKMVKPVYPPDAQAKGLRGIVILDVTIDKTGKVVNVELIRSIPGLDEAALEAVRQWEYEPVKVGGKPVAVRHTVPITFLMQLPEISRGEGIPELRQGAVPAYPRDVETQENATAVAELSVGGDGRVVDAEITSGTPPYAQALLQAVRTWAFAPDEKRGLISFRVEADFIGDRGQPRVVLRLTGLRQSESVGSASPAAAPAASPAGSPTAPASSTSPTTTSSAPAPTDAGSTAAAAPPAAAASSPAGAPAPTADPQAPPAPSTPSQPAVEVLRNPVEPPKPEPGISAVRDVNLAPGVPDLAKGRRPVPPPLARMAGVTGTVQVRFAIDASGAVSIGGTDGPDLLRPAAEAAVSSWTFRRTSTERLRAVAEIVYKDDGALAAVKLEP